MNSDKLSGRQLSVAALVAGLSWTAAFAGRADWRWLLLFSPPILLLGWLLVKKGEKGLLRGKRGVALTAVYGVWSVILLACSMERTAARYARTNGTPGDALWILLLLAIPLLRMAWGRSAPFFRAVEIFWLAVPPLLGLLFLFAVPRMEWRWLIGPMGDWRDSAAAAVLALSPLLFTLPYIYKVEGRSAVGWPAGTALCAAALSAVTEGLLSPPVASRLADPLFAASGVLGESVRMDGLVSALWLLPDLTLAGLLSRSWGGRFGPACAVGVAALLVLTEISNFFSAQILAFGTLILALLTLLVPVGEGRIVVAFW